MYLDDIKLFAKNENELETLDTVRIYSQYIRMEFGIETCAMLIMRSGLNSNWRRNRITITRKQKWEERRLYGYFERQTSIIV